MKIYELELLTFLQLQSSSGSIGFNLFTTFTRRSLNMTSRLCDVEFTQLFSQLCRYKQLPLRFDCVSFFSKRRRFQFDKKKFVSNSMANEKLIRHFSPSFMAFSFHFVTFCSSCMLFFCCGEF